MNAILLYLIQVIIASGILYGYYHWVLRNKEFHQYNRFYLLSAAVISLLLPLLQIPVYFANPDDTSARLLQGLQIVWTGGEVVDGDSAGYKFFTPASILYFIYMLVGLVFLVRFIIALFRIGELLRRYKAEHLEGVKFVNTNEPGTPFTFFRWLFWDRSLDLNSDNGRQVFRHEVYHIRQKHSWDVLFMEILRTIIWVNPFFHLMKKELRAIHEFLADRFAASETEKWSYAEFLLMQALETKHKLVNPFFHSQIKRRIAMITQSQKTSHRYLRKILALPIAALALTLVAFQVKHEVRELTLSEPLSISEQMVELAELQPVFLTEIVDTIPAKGTLKLSIPESSENKETTLKLRGTSAPSAEPLIIIDGKKVGQTIPDTLSPNSIQSVTVLKGASATATYGADGKDGVIVISTKKAGDTKEEEITLIGYSRSTQKTLELSEPKTVAGAKEVVVTGYATGKNAEPKEIVVTGFPVDPNAKPQDIVVTGYKKIVVTGYKKDASEKEVVVTGYPSRKQPQIMITADTLVYHDNDAKKDNSLPRGSGSSGSEMKEVPVEGYGSIYPNPANQQITVSIPSDHATSATVQIVTTSGDLTGVQKKVSLVKGNNTVTLSTSNLKAGTYLINVVTDKGKKTAYKMVKS